MCGAATVPGGEQQVSRQVWRARKQKGAAGSRRRCVDQPLSLAWGPCPHASALGAGAGGILGLSSALHFPESSVSRPSAPLALWSWHLCKGP